MVWLKPQGRRRMRISRSVRVTAIIVGSLAIISRLISLSPDDLQNYASAWWSLISGYVSWTNLLLLAVGFLLGYIVFRITGNRSAIAGDVSKMPAAITSSQFAEMFKQAIESKDYTSIKVFGYTGETVSDYFKYDHKYLGNMELRILNRSWIAEKADEELHNQRVSSLTPRKWDKAGGIKNRSQEPWPFPIKRTVKYYSTPPFVKAIVFKGPKRQEAFVTFYDWKELPSDGGSQFKGASLSMIHIPGESSEGQKVISYLDSQFDYYWKHKSNFCDEVLTEEKKPPRKTR